MQRFVTLPLLVCCLFLSPLALAAQSSRIQSSPTQLSQTQSNRTGAKTQSKTPARPAQPPLPPVDLPADPGIYAVIYTSMGNIVCVLDDKSAPKTVENFRGLATGTKAWKDFKTQKMRHSPLYSGTTFHRVIPGFMIQGGDPSGDGTGEPGYKLMDEIDPKLDFSQKGVLAMANSGPNTAGSQFFITVGPAEHLNGNYTIFGKVVSGQDVADAIANVPRDEANDKPNTPVIIKAIAIRTVKAPAAAGKPSE